MKIVTLATRYSVGGAQMNSLLIAEGLRSRGNDAEAGFLMRAGQMDVPVGLRTRIFKGRSSSNPFTSAILAHRLFKAVLAERPDVIIGFHPLANVLGALVSGFCPGVKFIATQRNPSQSQGWLLRKLEALVGSTRLYGANIAVTSAVRDTYSSHPAAYRRRMHVVHNGAPPLFESSEAGAAFRARHNLPAVPALGVLGRLADQKNPLFVLEILQKLTSFHVFFAGSGPLEGELRRRTEERLLTSRVHFLGELHGAEVTGFYRAIDFFVLPSHFEGFGRTLVEAMESGVAVVANRTAVTEEVVADAGVLVTLDPAQWARVIQELAADPDRREKLIRAGLQRSRLFSLASMVSGYERIAHAVIGHTTPLHKGAPL